MRRFFGAKVVAALAVICVAMLPASGAIAATTGRGGAGGAGGVASTGGNGGNGGLFAESGSALVHLRGQQLVHKFFALLKAGDSHQLAAFLAPGFQIQRASGTRLNKRQYLANHSVVVSFRISHLHVSAAPNLIIATYDVTARQYINGVIYKQTPQARLSVFEQIRGQWYIVAHAFFSTPAA